MSQKEMRDVFVSDECDHRSRDDPDQTRHQPFVETPHSFVFPKRRDNFAEAAILPMLVLDKQRGQKEEF